MSEARFWNDTKGSRESNLATLIRLAEVLGTTVDRLVGFDAAATVPSPETALLRQRLNLAADALAPQDLEFIVLRAEALAALPEPKR